MTHNIMNILLIYPSHRSKNENIEKLIIKQRCRYNVLNETFFKIGHVTLSCLKYHCEAGFPTVFYIEVFEKEANHATMAGDRHKYCIKTLHEHFKHDKSSRHWSKIAQGGGTTISLEIAKSWRYRSSR